MPTIRIDDQVYEWLQTQAKPFEDTPNTVLRRIANLEPGKEKTNPKQTQRAVARDKGQKTPQSDFRQPILEVLRKHGGQASRGTVLQALEKKLASTLTDYDKSDLNSGTVRWEKSAEWEVRIMREEGILKLVSETPRGVWAIA